MCEGRRLFNLAKKREAANLWDKFLEHIKSRVSINTFNTWFQPTRLNRADGGVVYVQIPTTVFRQVLTRTYGEIVKAVFHGLGVRAMRVAICLHRRRAGGRRARHRSGFGETIEVGF